MTTAHRPTYVPTKGGSVQGGNKLYAPTLQFSSKDLPSNLTLKTRRPGQGTKNEINRIDFKKQLIEREQAGLVSSNYAEEDDIILNNSAYADITSDLLALEEPKKKPRLESLDVSEIKNNEESNYVFLQDKDDSFSEDEEEEDEDEDTDEELMKEYEKIKQMREEEKRQKEKLEAEKLSKQTQEQILMGNPLLNNSYSLKKKWFEDTVFKNQSKTEVKVKKRFINDTVRSDFHRKFIAKSIQ